MADFFDFKLVGQTKYALVAEPNFRLGRGKSLDDLIGQCWGLEFDFVVVSREQTDRDLFELSNGKLGEVTQKLTNYHIRLIFLGDFSNEREKSRAFSDFERETNRGLQLRFLKNLPAH